VGEPRKPEEAKPIEAYPLTMTPTEAAEIVRLEPKTVMGLCAAGKIPARKVGGAWRIRRDVLWEWLRGA
jgi:excisionase family DNA binding protein